jgi:tetratricopeptide (TPR) repeat protein
VVAGEDTVSVYFPAYRGGKVIAEPPHYLRNERPVRGQVIDTESRRDLALIELEAVPKGAQGLKLAADSPDPGDRLHAVGNSSVENGLWAYNAGTVRQVCHTRLACEDQMIEARVILTPMPVNPGDSGGPVVNDDGELVGVVSAWLTEVRQVSYCIDVKEVRGFVAAARKLLSPATAAGYHARGLHYLGKGRYARAAADFTQAIRLDPKHAPSYRGRGISFLVTREYEKAVADFTRAIRLDPKDAKSYGLRSLACSALGEDDKARADVEKAREILSQDGQGGADPTP